MNRASSRRGSKAHGLQQVLFNMPPGDWDKGERGLACRPGREAEFRDGVGKALAYAQALACPRVHVMAGLLPAGTEREAVRPTYVNNLRWAAAQADKQGVQLLIEPINTRDIPGFFLNRQDHAHELIAEIGAANVKVQMDLYHCQIVEGDVAMKIRQYLPTGQVGHFQIAGVPERHEPDVGEMNYPYLFKVIDEVSRSAAGRAGSAANTGRRAARSRAGLRPGSTGSSPGAPVQPSVSGY